VSSKKTSTGFSLSKVLTFLVVFALFFGIFGAAIKVRASDRAASLAVAEHSLKQKQQLNKELQAVMQANPDITFSISTTNLNSGYSQTFGNDLPMDAASVGKLFTAILFMHEVETGQQSLSENIAGQNAKVVLKQLINQSDDGIWLTLNDRLSHQALTNYAQNLGLSSYNSSTNTVSSQDVATLLQKLYQDKLLSVQHTNTLLSYMQNTNYEQFISPAVPSGVSIYHKVGLINDNVNDAAIITKGDRSCVLVIFSDGHGTQDWDMRAATMQQMARDVISTYFN